MLKLSLSPIRLISATLVALLAACSEPAPWQFGFVGGLSGRVSDLGGPARNGMLLAVEEANSIGGINGRTIQTQIKDDKQDASLSVIAVEELLAANVDAIIGPVTSSMAIQVAPLANAAKTVMMGVTVTTNELSGLDDYFLRSLSPTAKHAGVTAKVLYQDVGIRSVAGVYDLRNESYSKGWINDFTTQFEAQGGTTTKLMSFSSQNPEELLAIADELLESQPEMVVFVTNAVDAALLAKLVREKNASIKIATSEWAGTERLIELGGTHVEGAYVPQYLDRESRDLDYQKFRSAYMNRFNQEPGFPGLVGYNATNVIITALRENPDPKQLKHTILRHKAYPSVQGDLTFDEFGDVTSNTYVTQIQNGTFRVLNRK